jgi:hypothetical protein
MLFKINSKSQLLQYILINLNKPQLTMSTQNIENNYFST